MRVSLNSGRFLMRRQSNDSANFFDDKKRSVLRIYQQQNIKQQLDQKLAYVRPLGGGLDNWPRYKAPYEPYFKWLHFFVDVLSSTEILYTDLWPYFDFDLR